MAIRIGSLISQITTMVTMLEFSIMVLIVPLAIQDGAMFSTAGELM
jgi:hypothetical protein